jgi:hypothetical protein
MAINRLLSHMLKGYRLYLSLYNQSWASLTTAPQTEKKTTKNLVWQLLTVAILIKNH